MKLNATYVGLSALIQTERIIAARITPMIDKYRLDDLRLESGEKGELARWVIQLQKDLDYERRKVPVPPAMAAKGSEPVADVVAWYKEGEERTCDIRLRRFDVAPGPLFAVAQPVMKDHQIRELVNELRDIAVEYHGTQQLRERIARTVRAAMLNHSENERDMVERVSQSYKLPATRFQQVADLYGITSPTGSETSFTFDAFEASSFAKSGWAVQEYVELERYQEAVAGNSPVIPDGWQFVPVEPTKDMIDAGWLHFMGTKNPSSKGTYKAMLAAAPQQEGN